MSKETVALAVDLNTAKLKAEIDVVTAALHWREARLARLESDCLVTMVAETEADMNLLTACTKLIDLKGGF